MKAIYIVLVACSCILFIFGVVIAIIGVSLAFYDFKTYVAHGVGGVIVGFFSFVAGAGCSYLSGPETKS